MPKHWNKREAEEDVARTKREVLPGICAPPETGADPTSAFCDPRVNETIPSIES